MKNMFKNAGKMVLFTCLSLMLLTACGQKSKLKLAIAAANNNVPWIWELPAKYPVLLLMGRMWYMYCL